ncbi:CPBP family intramembrane metalloprotease [Sediminibacterium roseum]|uniref:CPBP family intramembrane metalloprotease n=1 Tax=Sediminibacterium roseum TaxID=1978412 RepID=A0ABW9ZSR8_9BACT|nr:CPBP family intramembrane glutamic endopeptidase [Sediminibacterium roseum]NCI50156.1 CPBP family intramembrane metalloprotease [Sediminibacterium roseum]
MFYLLLLLLCVFSFTIGYAWRSLFKLAGGNLILFYLYHFGLTLTVIAVFYLLDKTLFTSISAWGAYKKPNIPGIVVDSIVTFCLIPLVLECVPFFKKSRGEEKYTQVFKGKILPGSLLPKNNTELLFFSLFTLEGVVLEEVLYRQVLFYILMNIWAVDPLVIISFGAALFSLAHVRKLKGELVPYFVLGLAFGIFYLYTRNLSLVIALHFLMNTTEIIIAYKRIRSGKIVS